MRESLIVPSTLFLQVASSQNPCELLNWNFELKLSSFQNGGGRPNPGFIPGVHEYDVPEGHDPGQRNGGGGGGGGKVSGAVTINGITV